MHAWQDESDLERELFEAQDRLERFERRALGKRTVARLRRHRPFHVVLVLRAFSLFGSVLLAIGTLGVLLVPLLGNRELTESISRLDGAYMPLPVALGLLFVCGMLFALGAHLAAAVLGRSAPLLPRAAREHQRLLSDVKRLDAMLSVNDRRGPASAERGYLGGEAATIPMSYRPSDAPTVLETTDNLAFANRRSPRRR